MLDFVLSMLKPHAGGNFKTTKPDGAGDGRRPRRPAAKAAANPDDGIVIDLTSSDESDTDTDGGEERGFFPALAPEASKRPLQKRSGGGGGSGAGAHAGTGTSRMHVIESDEEEAAAAPSAAAAPPAAAPAAVASAPAFKAKGKNSRRTTLLPSPSQSSTWPG